MAPSEIRGKSVEDIINEWDAELDARSQAFVRHAQALADWDRQILTNRHALLALEEQLARVRYRFLGFGRECSDCVQFAAEQPSRR